MKNRFEKKIDYLNSNLKRVMRVFFPFLSKIVGTEFRKCWEMFQNPCFTYDFISHKNFLTVYFFNLLSKKHIIILN